MVQAGEAGGNLDAVLLDLSATMEKQAVLNRQIRSAMTYPIVVLSVMAIIFLALLIFIVPGLLRSSSNRCTPNCRCRPSS
jgi:type IV pilus assembly protein PilC